jgi:hypothetical protein
MHCGSSRSRSLSLKKRNCSPKTSGRKKTKRENIFWKKKSLLNYCISKKRYLLLQRSFLFVREQKRKTISENKNFSFFRKFFLNKKILQKQKEISNFS